MKPETPTKTELHQRIADLERERNEHRNAAMEADLRTQAAVRGEKQAIARLTAITRWLEANQPDVFRRGLWVAIETPNAKAVGLAGIISESHTSDGLAGNVTTEKG